MSLASFGCFCASSSSDSAPARTRSASSFFVVAAILAAYLSCALPARGGIEAAPLSLTKSTSAHEAVRCCESRKRARSTDSVGGTP